ncbi:ketopantoate reductase family protein [Paenibacillus kribbensis]|uniref:ketopantoate reductase family protein n=1 Tax=Paenibacillus kribbensis TaxID=172713 RepID=UPI000838A3BE|nr:ketopantoate reductase family protein [Paenibacillus kribbensis]
MRFLVVGAGAVGGYFGGRLIQKGEDVTFLVRPSNKLSLVQCGLTIKSAHGDFQTPVQTITYGEASQPFDCIILAVKAYHLPQLESDLAPYVSEDTMILPLLNGYQHFESLRKHFGAEKVLGGLCYIETTLDHEGSIVQTSPFHRIVFGEWDGAISGRTQMLCSHLDHAGFTVTQSHDIQREIWQKYIFVASMSGITTLMGTSVGTILATPESRIIYEKLLHEIVTLVRDAEMPVHSEMEDHTLKTMESLRPEMMSSMQRDMQKNLPIEASHLYGSLLALASGGNTSYPILETVYARLKVYEGLLDTV